MVPGARLATLCAQTCVVCQALATQGSESLCCPRSILPISGPRRSAGPTRHQKARERVRTAAVSTMRAAVTPKTSTRTIAARPPASPAPRTTRATQTLRPSSRCCRPSPQPCRGPPVRPLQFPPLSHQEPRSSPHQGPRPLPPQALHRARPRPPSPLASHRLRWLLLPMLISSRHLPCTHSACPHRTPRSSL